MSSQLQQEAQSLSPSALISLFTLDASNVGSSVFTFCSHKEPDGTSVRFGGVEYPYIALKYDGFEWSSDGAMPRPKISAEALNSSFFSLVVLTNGIQGALIRRDRTLARFLDGHPDGGKGIKFPSDLYIVDRVTQLTKSVVTLELLTPLDLPREKVPARIALRDVCPFIYRRRVKGQWQYDQSSCACPYTGTACFDKHGKPCDEEHDECGRTVSDCAKRFGGCRALPFGGFPGLARNRA